MTSRRRADQSVMTTSTGHSQSPKAGATWRRVDLHLHSPGVKSFACPDGADLKSEKGRAAVAESYVEQLAHQQIFVAAITDYNGVRLEWFQLLASNAAGHGITILPGAELSFSYGNHGLHVLAVFPADTDLSGLNAFLHSLDRDPATPLFDSDLSHRDIALKSNLVESLHSLKDRFNCLFVLPHPNQKNGFCKTLQPVEAAQLLADLRPDAIEHWSDGDKRRLESTAILPYGFWDNLAFVEFSDPKRIEEIGTKCATGEASRATHLKLSATDLDAIRLALHDPETRLALGPVPVADQPKICSMNVSGSGFLGNLSIVWNDDLNVLIGGRGAGKSAILETLRYTLAIAPYSDQSFREELVRHALGSGGKVEVILERALGHGKCRRYLIRRVWGEEPRVTESDSNAILSIRPSELLGPTGGPTIFGQREIYTVSGSEEYRLALLDELIGEEARKCALAVQEAVELLRTNARSILAVRLKLAKRDEYRQRLKAVEHEIGIYEKHGAADKLREATRLRSDGQQLRSAREAVGKVRLSWQDTVKNLLAPLETAHRGLLRGQSQQKAILEDGAALLNTLRADLKTVFDQVASVLSDAERRMTDLSSRWQNALSPLEEEINRIKQEAQTEALDPDRLLRLSEERTGLAPLIEELEQAEEQLKDFEQSRRKLLSDLRDRRYAEHKLRRERAEEIGKLLQDRLRLTVDFKGQKEDYKKRLSSLLKGSGLSQDAVDRLVAPEATDGAALAEAVRAGSETVQKKFGLTPPMAERLINWLTVEPNRLFEVESLLPPDAVRLELRIDEQYRPINRLSVGQRATAVLLLLFALERRVLVLDQPEDDLDNRFVYEDIVQILREQKGIKDDKRRRQIIAATHNANIPVLGDAELVLALEARDNHSQVVGRASLDDRRIRELVKTIMEGGEEAFRRRAEKYGGVPKQ